MEKSYKELDLGLGDVEKLKKELKELIDHKIEYNNGFANLLRGDYSLFLSLIALILSVYGAWKLGFLARHYVLSVYLMFGIWLLYSITDPLKRALKRAPGEKVREDLNKLRGFMTHFRGIILEILNWAFKVARPMIYSLWMLFFLCIVVLLFLRDFRWWMWAPAILFTLSLPPIAKKGAASFVAQLDEVRIEELSTLKEGEIKRAIVLILILAILILAIVICFGYIIVRELLFIILKEPYSIFEVILTMLLILISLAFLSEYLSMKFMVTEVSGQNYKLSVLRIEIERIEDAEMLKKQKQELLKWYLPQADSFLLFFNYYYPMFTKYTFEVGEEDKEAG